MKPHLLIIELWGLGDAVIATPFIRSAAHRFQVTLLGKPYTADLQQRFWPDVQIVPFHAPWTAFSGKYRVWSWKWSDFSRIRKQLRGKVDIAVSARWDPRDHVIMALTRAKRRIGFPRVGSRVLLTDPLQRPSPAAHRYEYWRALGEQLGIQLPEQRNAFQPVENRAGSGTILIHSGAGQPVRVWPLPRFKALAERLRGMGYPVQIACDEDQRGWWTQFGEPNVVTPRNVPELLKWIDEAGVFIGNDSGPGHLAALTGVPTFTLFGPQNPEWFAPLHPAAEVMEGKPCPYKPCSDYCRFPTPICLHDLAEAEVLPRVERFVRKHLGVPPAFYGEFNGPHQDRNEESLTFLPDIPILAAR